MSTKSCSLAVDDVELESHLEEEVCFEPKLTVLVNKRNAKNSPEDAIVKVTGRINVSF
ncbi:MAG: hypothetical protein VX777_04320 [Chlamydiota bacterium]|nr:hypothetical protein [Chlamydiota bacterium]